MLRKLLLLEAKVAYSKSCFEQLWLKPQIESYSSEETNDDYLYFPPSPNGDPA